MVVLPETEISSVQNSKSKRSRYIYEVEYFLTLPILVLSTSHTNWTFYYQVR